MLIPGILLVYKGHNTQVVCCLPRWYGGDVVASFISNVSVFIVNFLTCTMERSETEVFGQ